MKLKLLVLTVLALTFCSQSFGQPANDTVAGAIPITPSAEGTGCSVATFNLPFSTDGTTDSGVQGGCRLSGLDQFFTWTATTNALFFSSDSPGNPGIVVWDATGTVEIDCADTFATTSLTGWNIGDDLVLQIYDFQNTALSDVAFCLEAITYTPPPPIPVTFTSQSSGASGDYRLAVVDMNGDFLDDMVSVSSTNINIREQGAGGTFTTKNIATTNADNLPSWSLAAADYDGNGYTDLLYGGGNGVTFMKANSTGTAFTEISGPQDVFSQRSNFVDINKDGHLDAFVCHDVAPNVYYINDGSGNLSFNQGGLGDYPSGGNYGSIWIDYDNDRDLDMFIAKCGGEPARRLNEMHTNDGSENYSENAAALGLADQTQTWSAAWGDFDNDGDMDVFIGASSLATASNGFKSDHRIMRNDGGVFTEVTAGSGISVLTATNTDTVTFDFDNDGNLDLVSGGNIMFGHGDMTFDVYTDVFPGAGAYGDLNNDGYIDAFNSGSMRINNAESNNNWIKIHTVGTSSNIHGIGARIEVHTPSGVKIRDVKSGDGFRYMNSLNTHIGLGTEASITEIIVYWPNSGCETFSNPAINQSITITEGAGVRCDAVVSPKIYLQGASLNPNSGEENLMRDDLRANGWLASSATTSPYADALVADVSVFNITGDDAIVDWVFVELRDKDDNSIILDSQSALLQRDGDVVDIDGVSPLVFSQASGNAFIAVKHRNHIGLISADTFRLSPVNTVVDLSSDPNAVEGQTNAVNALANGKFGMYTGDFDGNEQVQNADANGVIQLLGGSGYNDADMDANTQVQNTDVNTLINPNIGRGQQFRTDGNADVLSPSITVAFDNAEITNDGSNDYYEADIFISSTEDFKLGSGQLYINYNEAAFGSNISSNGSLEYSQPNGSILGEILSGFPVYKDFIENDNTTSRVSISFQQGISSGTMPIDNVIATPKLLCHIKILYQNAAIDPNICFDTDPVFLDQFFTACGPESFGFPDCTNNPGIQILDDTYDCSEAGVETLNVNDFTLNSITLYPNPVDNILYLKGVTSDLNKIDIFNINGQLINTIESNFNQIDVSQLDPAVYLIKFYTTKSTTVKRLIKR
ncbi:FG-GAP-like repeat-containing protein [Psychroserpens sp. MEBiC05023]